MKLLLDENISRRLVPALQKAYPGTSQLALLGLEQADDMAIWDYAKREGYILVSKDTDFLDLFALFGYPPKIIYLALGNCANQQILDSLLHSQADICAQLSKDEVGLVEIY